MMVNDYNNCVVAIVLNWNNWSVTKSCVQSLINAGYDRIRIVIVDNDSTDDSVDRLKVLFPDIPILVNSANGGFAKGCNVGFRFAHERGADYILLINNDCVVSPGFLGNSIEILDKDPSVYAVTGKIYFDRSRNVLWQAGGHIDMWRIQGVGYGCYQTDDGSFNSVKDTGWASGAFSLFPRRTLDDIGYLPEEYFFGQEEWDYSVAILKRSMRIVYNPYFECEHSSGNSYRSNHPVLLIYGCFLNKNIFARKYLSAYRYKLWRFMFVVYVYFIWPFRARSYVSNYFSLNHYTSAARLAVENFDNIGAVTLDCLKDACIKLKVPSRWSS